MKDVIYTSDIPSDYHYVRFGSDYIDLFNQPSAQNETLQFYRIYYRYSPGTYITGTQSFSDYDRTYFDDYPVSGDIWYRPDLDKILLCVFIISVFGFFLINLVTSIVKKGGILGGLLW